MINYDEKWNNVDNDYPISEFEYLAYLQALQSQIDNIKKSLDTLREELLSHKEEHSPP